MSDLMDHPVLLFVFSFFAMWLSTQFGMLSYKRRRNTAADLHESFQVIETATLTLLGLIIGFTFSMAISRYDLRKNYEEEEANAIGTEYVRTDLLPAEYGEKARALLVSYLEQRILFYKTRDTDQLRQIDARKSQLQSALWASVVAPAATQPTQIVALAVSGMNDVLNSEGYTNAAWWNRIPLSAWCLMGAIAVVCNTLVGYGARKQAMGPMLQLVLPLVVSLSFMLIADIDSPRGGLILVHPQNLTAVAMSLRTP